MFWGVKCDGCVRLTTLSPSMSRLSRQCEILNILQPYRTPRPVMEIALLYFTLLYFTIHSPWIKYNAIYFLLISEICMLRRMQWFNRFNCEWTDIAPVQISWAVSDMQYCVRTNNCRLLLTWFIATMRSKLHIEFLRRKLYQRENSSGNQVCLIHSLFLLSQCCNCTAFNWWTKIAA
jgi:hypothetical protein